MKFDFNMEERKPIWIALSDFYIDNELQDVDFKSIASTIKESPYSLKEIKLINEEEVFPVLYANLLSVAGVWTGFQEDWLVDEIQKKIQRKTLFGNPTNRLRYQFMRGMFKDYWKKLEEQIKNSDFKT